MKFIEKLDELMSREGISRAGLSKSSGVPYTTIINFYEKGTDNIKLSTLRKLADYFDVSIDYLVDDETEETVVIPMTSELVMLPIVGRVSCGEGAIAYEDIEGYEPTPKEWISSGDYFYLRASGDSMIGARIYNDDLLLIRRQHDVENGEIAVVLIGDEAVLKKVYYNGGQLVLQSENPKYQPIFAPPTEAKIIGKLKINVIKY